MKELTEFHRYKSWLEVYLMVYLLSNPIIFCLNPIKG